MIIDNLDYLVALEKTDTKFSDLIERHCVDSYEKFIVVLYRDLEKIAQMLQTRKQLYYKALEDEISMYIVDRLVDFGYNAFHDPKQGGHVDIFVSGRGRDWQWLGEAKRDYGGNSWFEKGFHQLCRRYSDGGYSHIHGGILVYVQGKYANQQATEWRNHLATLEHTYQQIEVRDCDKPSCISFESSHTHDTSGLPYVVRHLFIGLYHDPIV